MKDRAGGRAQVVEHLLIEHKVLSSNSSTTQKKKMNTVQLYEYVSLSQIWFQTNIWFQILLLY
jgi:hypothetical protein